jgi:transcription initiation factor IIE alpha subunit
MKALKKEKQPIKQKFEFRQKNLTCPHKHYHMKVPFGDLTNHRPSCPKCGSPMLVKEELKEVVTGSFTIEQVIEASDIKSYLV